MKIHNQANKKKKTLLRTSWQIKITWTVILHRGFENETGFNKKNDCILVIGWYEVGFEIHIKNC